MAKSPRPPLHPHVARGPEPQGSYLAIRPSPGTDSIYRPLILNGGVGAIVRDHRRAWVGELGGEKSFRLLLVACCLLAMYVLM